jgi:hypothetical protein
MTEIDEDKLAEQIQVELETIDTKIEKQKLRSIVRNSVKKNIKSDSFISLIS